MSEDHVAVINTILRRDPAVHEACARLAGPRVLAYRLEREPGGEPVHWTIAFEQTVQFSLAEAAAPDVVLVGDWSVMIRAAKANREGVRVDPELSVEGDEEILDEILQVLGLASDIATVPVTFPVPADVRRVG
ncbi:hypothetical protein [Jiangella endophytica]|uniref:hypothetical protein n=1 Tax=Jiangella endophytica TaxID=1623398 RepID=UPI0018E593ED|nr:hypothetical protein [Jiangella endophytica]